MKNTLKTLLDKKQNKELVSAVTCYNYWQAQIIDKTNIDWILIGDSMGMTELGYKNTNPVTMEEMLIHTRAVVRGNPHQFIVGDMPYMSYQISNESAIENASKFIKEGCDSIKIEGCLPERIKAISNAGILVMGHLGLTPQSTATFGGYKVQGKNLEEIDKITKQCIAIQEAGCFAILLEAMPTEATKYIRQHLKIPIYSIGAGIDADGQLIIFHDITGLFFDFKPKFVHKFCDAGELILNAIKDYDSETKNGKFPYPENMYKMKEQK